MTDRAQPPAQEFVCTECGTPVVIVAGARSEFCLCFECIWLPGWHRDPTLRAMLGPNLPPLPEQSGEATS